MTHSDAFSHRSPDFISPLTLGSASLSVTQSLGMERPTTEISASPKFVERQLRAINARRSHDGRNSAEVCETAGTQHLPLCGTRHKAEVNLTIKGCSACERDQDGSRERKQVKALAALITFRSAVPSLETGRKHRQTLVESSVRPLRGTDNPLPNRYLMSGGTSGSPLYVCAMHRDHSGLAAVAQRIRNAVLAPRGSKSCAGSTGAGAKFVARSISHLLSRFRAGLENHSHFFPLKGTL